MINAKVFISELKKIGVDFYSGVPDSLMSEFSKSLHFDYDNKNHVIAANEGTALGISMGYHLSSEKIPLILSLIHISEPTRLRRISYAGVCV